MRPIKPLVRLPPSHIDPNWPSTVDKQPHTGDATAQSMATVTAIYASSDRVVGACATWSSASRTECVVLGLRFGIGGFREAGLAGPASSTARQ
jgi:hypothetical protein